MHTTSRGGEFEEMIVNRKKKKNSTRLTCIVYNGKLSFNSRERVVSRARRETRERATSTSSDMFVSSSDARVPFEKCRIIIVSSF